MRFARAALQAAFIVSNGLGLGLAERLFTTPRRYPRPDRERTILASGTRFEIVVRLRSPRWDDRAIDSLAKPGLAIDSALPSGALRAPENLTKRGRVTNVVAWRWGIGPTVLLVHGWEGRGSQLGAFVEPLVAAGLSVVAFDAPAHGDSPGQRLYLTDHADAIADVVDQIGPVHAVVAHSFGAAAVVLAHARHRVDIARNVMLAPNVIIEDAVEKFARTVGLDDRDRARFEHQIAQSSGVPIESLDVERLTGTRDAALLVIHDRGDREVSARHGERLAAAWPNAHLVLTEEFGHRRVLREPVVVDRVVDFVREGLPLPASDLVREVDRLLRSG